MLTVQACHECGFDPAAVDRRELPEMITTLASAYTGKLTGTKPAALRMHGAGLGWSALEYAGHVRDVLELFDRRVGQIQVVEWPDLEVIDHDALVAEGRYGELDPAEVAEQIRDAAAQFRGTLIAIRETDWERAGRRAGEERSIADVAYRAVHEENHHLYDIDRLVGSGQRSVLSED